MRRLMMICAVVGLTLVIAAEPVNADMVQFHNNAYSYTGFVPGTG